MSTITDSTSTITGDWELDVAHSTIAFSVKHMVVSTFRGRFERYRAQVETVDGRSRLVGTVDADSIEVKNPDLAAHLLAPDFFDAERHPQLRFVSTRIAVDGDRVEVEGDLTIRGVTRAVRGAGAVTGPVEDPYGSTRLGVELEAVIDRREYGLEWNMPLPKGGFALGNDVKIAVNLEFTKAS
jgi:polyisoprenoid-binding protein YceI